jgi:hypothetical protein
MIFLIWNRRRWGRKLTDAFGFGSLVEDTLDVGRYGRGTLVDEGIARLVVEESCDTHALLLASRKHVLPHLASVPATLSLGNVAELALL